MIRTLIAALFVLIAAPAASAQSFNAQQQSEIRAVVRDYLVHNPDVLREAVEAMQARETAERVARAQNDPRDFAIGPRNAPITIVEFFDYRCPFCMQALPWVQNLLRTRHDVRFVFKEMPIYALHGQPAVEASEASIAAMPQGRYFQFHQALLSFEGDLTPARIDQIARQSGIDVPRMRRAMGDPNITKLLQDNYQLVTDLTGSPATPTFLVNGHIVSGADEARLNQLMQQALQR